MGVDEDEAAGADDGRRRVSSETAAASLRRLHHTADLAASTTPLSYFVCFPCVYSADLL